MKVVLHIGHGKTGSSYIQSRLAVGQAVLRENGIVYPEHESTKRAAQGKFAAGNAAISWSDIEKLPEKISADAARYHENHTLLYSSERLFQQLSSKFHILKSLARKYSVTIVLFIRNPWDLAASSYVQGVKRHNVSAEFSAYLRNPFSENAPPSFNYVNVLGNVEKMVRRIRENDINSIVLNYSHHEATVFESFMGSLGLGDVQIPPPPFKTVNRSLSRAEIEFQRQFNRMPELRSHRFISDPLCNQLPDIESEIPYADAEAVSEFLEKITPTVIRINELLPAGERYEVATLQDILARYGDHGDGVYRISKEQIALLASSIAKEMQSSQGKTS